MSKNYQQILFQVQNIAEELQLNKNNVTTEDNLSIGDDREDYDDKKPMIPKDGSKDSSLMSTIIGRESFESIGTEQTDIL